MKTRWHVAAVLAGLIVLVAVAVQAPSFLGAATAPTAPALKGAAATPTTPPPTYDEAMADPNRKVGFIKKTLKDSAGKEHIYQVWVPLDYTPKQKWPLILFLHGSGESGTDGEKMMGQGLPGNIKRRKGQFEFIVVVPQSTGGWSGAAEETALKGVKTACTEYSVDTDRIYLTGLSMGGFGAWDFARRYPKSFAACVPIAGGCDSSPATVAILKTMPLWVWHGDNDGTVKPDSDRQMITALVKANAVDVRYTELKGVGHDSWSKAYSTDEVFEWLLQHKVSDLGRQKPVKPVIDAATWDGAAALTPATSTSTTPTTAVTPTRSTSGIKYPMPPR
jgi:predicted peptidase